MADRRDGMHYRWFAKDEVDEYGMPKSRAERELWVTESRERKLYRRSERVGIVLSFAVLFYGISEMDMPAVFFALAFQLMELQKLLEKYGGTIGESVANGMRVFAGGLFVGALFLLFFQ